MKSSVYFWHVSGNQYQIWFDVTGEGTMDELGVRKIVVERSTDEVDWEPVKTYNKADYSEMTLIPIRRVTLITFPILHLLVFHTELLWICMHVIVPVPGVMTETTEVLDLR